MHTLVAIGAATALAIAAAATITSIALRNCPGHCTSPRTR